MRAHRLKAKADNNQSGIVKALRSIPGLTVEFGHDDILVGYKGRTYWYEIKQSEKSPATPHQKDLVAKWRGHYRIVHSLDEILRDIGL